MSDSSADVAKVAELIKDFRFAMVTTVNTLGELVARPLTVQEASSTATCGSSWPATPHAVAALEVQPRGRRLARARTTRGSR